MRVWKPGLALRTEWAAVRRPSVAGTPRKQIRGLEEPRLAPVPRAQAALRREVARPSPRELVEPGRLRVGPHPCRGAQRPRPRPRSGGLRTRSNLPRRPFPRPPSAARSNASQRMSQGSRHRVSQDRAAGKCTGAVRLPDSEDGSGRTHPIPASETLQGRQSAARPGPSCRLGLKVGVRTAWARLRPRCRSSCEW